MATGRAAGERVERARAVSALIGTDAAAHGAFDRAYAGRGEALDALSALIRGEAADPERNATLDRHRRSAFARPAGPAAEAAATAALVALRREVEWSDADSAALDRAIAVVLERDAERRGTERAATDRAAAAPAAASESAAPQPRRWVRPVLASLIIVAAIAVGVGVGVGVGGTTLLAGALPGPGAVDASPSPITYFRDPAARDTETIGDTEAADRWFRSEQTTEDAYPVPFDGIDPGSTRLVHTGTDGWRAWVGRSENSEYCLLAYSDSDGSGASSCIVAEGFAQTGASMSAGGITLTWTGADLTVETSRR
ncbi:hypothetical protein [Marisediminicola antarctica]|uniref:Uncharacterized protein n=1 Tax=Marisediminicola antarctica TaxID=674079 RepID=A0A7L5ADZ2_9MICO|nr:hypothetical protein [Marisediminicola antarctica]QHO68488.1 hypothetical protein BHD05_01405 [Marisediminicola antarctica]